MRRAFTKSFLLVLAILVIVEIAMRAFWSRGLSGRFDYGYHPTAGFVEKSGGALDLVRAGGRRFHPQRFAQQKPAGTFRIMVVGDSVPRGPSLAEAYPTRVAELESACGIPSEGWNLCLPGYGAHRCHVVLTHALKYQPDFVIRHVNNSNEYEDEREWRRSQDFQGWHPKNLLMKSLLVRRLHEMKTEGVFWSLLPEKIRAQQGVNDAGAKIIAMTDETQIRAWQERVRRFLKEDLDLCRKAGVPVLLITQVRMRGTGKSATLDDSGLDDLARSFAAPGVDVLTMKDVLSGTDFVPLFMDTAHLNGRGHEIFARAIAEKITPIAKPPAR